jgi:putative transposase
VFVIELHSRRVFIVGSTPHPDDVFMLQVARQLTAAGDGVLDGRRFLICDRDRKWSTAVQDLLTMSGVRIIRTTVPRAELQRARGAVCSLRQRGMDRLIPWVSGTSAAPSPSSSSTIIASATIRGSATT